MIWTIGERHREDHHSSFSYQHSGDIPTGTPLTGASNAGGVGKKTRFWTNICLYWTSVYWCLQHLPRNADCSISWSSICTKLARSILMRDRNTGTQPNLKKTLSKCGILSPKNSCSHFLRCVSNKFAAVKNQWMTSRQLRTRPPFIYRNFKDLCGLKQHRN